MPDVVFARTRHNYESYVDYWRLVELSGFPVVYVDDIPREGVRGVTYIVTPFNGEWQDGIQTDARVILYDLEWHLDGLPTIPGVSELWAGDKHYAECIGAKYVPMGSHPGLCPEQTPRQDVYDVAYLAYLVPRRQRIRSELIATGLNVSPSSAWGSDRHTILRNSAAYLHVHQLENAPTIAPLRMVVAAAYALPYITETVADAGIFKRHILQADYGYLVNATVTWTRQATKQVAWERDALPVGMSLHQKLCIDLTFKKSIECAL